MVCSGDSGTGIIRLVAAIYQNPEREWSEFNSSRHCGRIRVMSSGENGRELKAGERLGGKTMNLMYYGFASVSVRGPATGQLYRFSKTNPVQMVDARDARSILKTRLFRRIR
jgi:hypothetical protein